MYLTTEAPEGNSKVVGCKPIYCADLLPQIGLHAVAIHLVVATINLLEVNDSIVFCWTLLPIKEIIKRKGYIYIA